MGTEPGSHTLLATAAGPTGFPLNGSPVTFSAQGVRPPPARLVLRQAPSDLAQNGIVFSRQPVIGVLDAEDQPVPGVAVAVAIAAGPGTLNGTTTASTDGAGRAVFTDLAILGTVGSRTLAFTATGQTLAPVTAPVEVRAGPFARIEALQPVAYQEIVGSPVSPAPSVLVTDDDGNPVPGVVVSFTADRDASVSPTTIPTDQRGIAQVTSWTLGRTADTRYTLSARLPNGNPVTFTADAKAGAAGRLEIVVQPSSTRAERDDVRTAALGADPGSTWQPGPPGRRERERHRVIRSLGNTPEHPCHHRRIRACHLQQSQADRLGGELHRSHSARPASRA